MNTIIIVLVSSQVGGIDIAPPPRLKNEDVVARFIRLFDAEKRAPNPYTEAEEEALLQLHSIALAKRGELELLALLERLQASRPSPRSRQLYSEMSNRARGRIAALDEEELRIRLSVPPLPEIVLPHRP